jgi:hypothetical protein
MATKEEFASPVTPDGPTIGIWSIFLSYLMLG